MAKTSLSEKHLSELYPRRSDRKQRTRNRIIETAQSLFNDPGYKQATMARIAEQAEVHVTTVFNHFSSKAELMAAITAAHLAGLELIIDDQLGKTPFFVFYRELVCVAADDHTRNAHSNLGMELFPGDDLEILPTWLSYEVKQAELLATYIAADYAIDLAVDVRPTLVANMLVTGNVQVYKTWRESGCTTDLKQNCLQVLAATEQLVAESLGQAL